MTLVDVIISRVTNLVAISGAYMFHQHLLLILFCNIYTSSQQWHCLTLGVQCHSRKELACISLFKFNNHFVICFSIWVTFHEKCEDHLYIFKTFVMVILNGKQVTSCNKKIMKWVPESYKLSFLVDLRTFYRNWFLKWYILFYLPHDKRLKKKMTYFSVKKPGFKHPLVVIYDVTSSYFYIYVIINICNSSLHWEKMDYIKFKAKQEKTISHIQQSKCQFHSCSHVRVCCVVEPMYL